MTEFEGMAAVVRQGTAEIIRLRAVNEKLLWTLKAVRKWIGPNSDKLSRKEIVQIMERAIRKAEERVK